MNPTTKYSTLLHSFAQLYQDLTQKPVKGFLSTTKVAKFIANSIFTSPLPKPCLFEELHNNIEKYRGEVEQLLGVTSKIIAEGFDYQKSAIFGFAPSRDTEA